MKTKFILHGGFTPGQKSENNKDFFKEVLKDAPKKPKILLVCFAKDIDRIPVSTTKVMDEFNKNKWQEKLIFEVANEESFIKQVESADVVYLHGGITLKLLNVLKKFPNLKELFEGKIIVGESAGANVLGKLFYSPSANGTFEGLGLLSVKIIPHYSEKYKGVFKDMGPDLESLYLREYQYKVLYSES